MHLPEESLATVTCEAWQALNSSMVIGDSERQAELRTLFRHYEGMLVRHFMADDGVRNGAATVTTAAREYLSGLEGKIPNRDFQAKGRTLDELAQNELLGMARIAATAHLVQSGRLIDPAAEWLRADTDGLVQQISAKSDVLTVRLTEPVAALEIGH